MKISKLFHWLYALVMLLPIFAIGVTCGYAMFNKNAYLSNENKSVKQEIRVNNANELIVNDTYHIVYDSTNSGFTPRYKFSWWSINPTDYDMDLRNYTSFLLNSNGYAYFYYDNYTDNDHRVIIQIWGTTLKSFNFTLSESISSSNINNASQVYLIEYNKEPLINAFYYSIDKVQQSPLFNWAYNSFLVTPFAYIVSLFSMPQNSFIVMLLSYWLAISIIWLVFDLVMYVPLLVHRWIDKGVLE